MTKSQTKPVLILIKRMVGHTTPNEPPLWEVHCLSTFSQMRLVNRISRLFQNTHSKSNWHIKLCTSDIVCLKINLFPLSYAASVTCVFFQQQSRQDMIDYCCFRVLFFLNYHWQLEENTAQVSFNSLQKKCLSIINYQELEEIWRLLALTTRQL